MSILPQYLRWLFWLPNPKPRKSVLDEAMELDPGQVSLITNKDNGNEYALLHMDDFDHVLSMAKMQMGHKTPNTVHERKWIGN